MNKLRVGILGATGMVGQRFISLLSIHPWFTITTVAASARSANKPYSAAVEGRWQMPTALPSEIAKLTVLEVEKDAQKICESVDLVFSALDMDKEQIKAIEDRYAGLETPVISNNSAHRWTSDVPMFIPEINIDHLRLIDIQRKARGWKRGLIAVKPNCSIQSYVPVLHALKKWDPQEVVVTSIQAISGAGKNFETWPEMLDNVIPFIKGEEEKSEREPLKVWANIQDEKLILAERPRISATCIRIPVSDGHMASVSVKFKNAPSRQEIVDAITNFQNPLVELSLPSAPKQFLHFFEDQNRPQTKLDRDIENGMAISVGRLEQDSLADWRFVALSHNTLRGAAGGAVLTAELLKARGYLD